MVLLHVDPDKTKMCYSHGGRGFTSLPRMLFDEQLFVDNSPILLIFCKTKFDKPNMIHSGLVEYVMKIKQSWFIPVCAFIPGYNKISEQFCFSLISAH